MKPPGIKSRSPNLGPYTTKGPIKGSTFWILPGVWVQKGHGGVATKSAPTCLLGLWGFIYGVT